MTFEPWKLCYYPHGNVIMEYHFLYAVSNETALIDMDIYLW